MKPMQPMKPMEPMQAPAAGWWPDDLGHPASSGAQDGWRYAVFPHKRRLAIEKSGKVQLFDTGDHAISGISQQQDGQGTSPTFVSQHGKVDLDALTPVK
ncbi:hypothetical protein ACSFBL_00325 [Variovorax sp. GT1P44]